MIVGSLYPTYETTVVGTPTANKEVYTTASWGGGQVTSMESYWLGWINYENLPACFHRAAAYIEDGTGDLVVKDMTVQGNFPCGYIWNNYSNTHLQVEDIYISNPSYYKTGYCWLFNENYPEYSGLVYDSTYSNRAEIRACVFISDMGGNIVYPYDKSDNENYIVLFDSDGSTYIDDLYKFLFLGAHYTATKLVPVGEGFVTLSFDITADMLESGTGYIQDSSGMYNMRFYVVDAYFGKGCALKNNGTISLAASFTVKLSESYDGENSDIIRTGHFCNEYLNRIWFYRYGTPTESNPAIGLGIKGDARIVAASLAAVVNGGVGAHATDGNVFIHVNDNRLYVSAITTLDDIKKSLSLYYRVCRENLPSYVVGKTYATDVTPDNEFLARLKTGDIEDTTFKSSLRPWQYSKFTDDEFTEEDIPSPEPEPGGDTPGDEPQDMPHDDGDPPELQKNRTIAVPAMFITQYALTSAELQTVGSNLWTSWLNQGTDVYLNFFLPYAQDFGTLNIGAALDFIVSLKVFPFEFTIDYLTPASNGVRMGTGHTDFLGSSTSIVKSQIICIDAGTLKVELPQPYNDFRDMYNCSALCFMPYCGTVELNLQEILNRTLKASYFIDLQSGGCTCVIECAGDAGDYVIASKPGQIGFSIPLTATNAGQLTAQLMSDATRAVGTIGGLFFDVSKSIGSSVENLAKIAAFNKTSAGQKNPKEEPTGMTVTQSIGVGESGFNAGLSLANQAIDMLSRSAVEMPMLSGGGSAESFMFADCVSIQIRRGRYKKPDNYPHSVGYYNLSSHPISYFKGKYSGTPPTGSSTDKGFCTFTGVDTSGLDCREDEIAEIVSLLESGVYL